MVVATPRFKKLYLEITNICNLQCSFCPVVERDDKSLGQNQLESYFQKIAGWAERVCLHVMGEPTSHPEFPAFTETAREYAIDLEITTNGILLSEKVRQGLLNPAVRQINFSLQSFFDNFPSKDPSRYLSQIFTFAKTAQERRPDLYINFRLWNLGSVDDKDVTEFVLKQIEAAFPVKINRTVDPGFRKSKRVAGRIYLHFDSRFQWPSPKGPVLASKGRCHGAVSHLAIHANGDVVPCCLDKEANIKLGNLQEQNLSEIVASDRYKNMFEGFQRGELIEDLCRRCSYIQRFT